MDEKPTRQHQRQQSKRRIGPTLLVIVLTSLALVAGYAARIYTQTKNAVGKTYDPVSSKVVKKTTIKADKPLSFLLLGTDTGEFGRKEVGNSDTMIVVTLNPKANRTTMTSIPRDTLAEIVGGGPTSYQKINAAYALGGNVAAMQTVTKLLNVPFNYYVTVNMAGLEKIVDAVGGIDVNVKFSWQDPDSGNLKFTKGPMHLNGKWALSYARMRHQDSDYGRQQRQQEVITQIVKKILSAKSLSNYSTLMDSLADSMRTSLTFDEMVQIAQQYSDCIKHVKQATLQGMGAYIGTGAYQIPTTKAMQTASDNIRAELGLAPETLNTYNVKQNALNTQHGFNWNDGNNRTYTLYPN